MCLFPPLVYYSEEGDDDEDDLSPYFSTADLKRRKRGRGIKRILFEWIESKLYSPHLRSHSSNPLYQSSVGGESSSSIILREFNTHHS